MVWGFLGLWRI